MPAVTVRNIPEATHRALRLRAAQAGRSTEAEIRYILEKAVQPAQRIKVGDAIHKLAMQYGGFELNIQRSKEPGRAAVFE